MFRTEFQTTFAISLVISIFCKTPAMKKLGLLFLFTVGFWLLIDAQTKPAILTEPAGWQLEQFALPPVFASTLKYKRIEELRFSPDMFKKGATGYFTYVFVARLDSTQTLSQSGIKDYLLVYFKGLCSKTAADRKLSPIYTAAIHVTIGRKIPRDTSTSNKPVGV